MIYGLHVLAKPTILAQTAEGTALTSRPKVSFIPLSGAKPAGRFGLVPCLSPEKQASKQGQTVSETLAKKTAGIHPVSRYTQTHKIGAGSKTEA